MKSARKYTALRLALLGVLLGGFTVSTIRAYDDPRDRYRPPVQAAGWQLGVGVKNLRGGSAITRILPQSSAREAGLEVGDIILSVNGVPVGYAGGVLNDLEDELNRQADALGRVALRIRNGRNGALATVPVRLTPAPQWQPPVQPPWWEWQGKGKGVFPPVDPVRANIDSFYTRYLGRRPDRVGMQNWLTQIGQGMRIEEVHANILASAEFYDRCQNNEAEWVSQLYQLAAGRRATPQEIRQWVTLLNRTYQGQRLPLSRDFLKAIGQY
jgi:hypothetical protein